MTVVAQLRQRLTRHERPFRFLVAGAVNTGVGIALFPLLAWSNDWLHDHYMVTLLLSQLLCIALAFVTYKVALSGDRTTARQVGVFGSFYVVQYCANLAALPFLVEVVRLNPVAAQLAFIVALVTGSYLWHSRLTFPHQRA
jgi:putative flippase GtrA